MTHRFARRLIATMGLGMIAMSAFADAQDDAIRTHCPGAQAWMDRMAALSGRQAAPSDVVSDPRLRDALRDHFKADAEARQAWIAAQGARPAAEHMNGVDRENLAWMKTRFANGLPTAAQVGREGLNDAFVMVQHADANPTFQASMLPSITAWAKQGDLPRGDVALLTDRVLRAEGKPQRYGTQYVFTTPGDLTKMKRQPTEDPAHLAQRRASMDLMSSADYECVLKVTYAGSAGR